jgi:hypothetical protein
LQHLDSQDGALLRYHDPLNWLPASRLLLPRSGLERSDFVLWHIATFRFTAEFGRNRCIADMAGLAGGPSPSRFSSEQILACEKAGITVTLPKPMTSHSKAEGRFGKQDFRHLVAEDVYVCPAGERLT